MFPYLSLAVVRSQQVIDASPLWAALSAGAGQSPSTDPVAFLLQYGVLGIVVIGFIFGWIVPGPQARQLLDENRRLTALIENKLLPMSEQYAVALDRSAIVMDKATSALEKAIETQRPAARDFTGR